MADAKSKLKEALELLLETQDEDKTFRVYKDRKIVGDLIFKELIGKRKGVDSDNKPVEGFYLTSKNNEVGLMSQLYGIVGLLSLISRYKVEPTKEEIKIIKNGINEIVRYIVDSKGYDLSPYLDFKVNEDFFDKTKAKNKNKPTEYVGARTWAMALFTLVRKLHVDGIITFSEDEMEKIKARIRGNIKFFIHNVIYSKDGESKPIGWGYANDCEEPSLFFTYSVIEAFADFDDVCVGSSLLSADAKKIGSEANNDGFAVCDDELLKYINEGNQGEPLEKQLAKICLEMGDRAWDIFGDALKNSFFGDRFDYKSGEGISIVSKDEISNSSRSSVLFNNLYVIFILFYTYKNRRLNQSDKLDTEIKSSMSLSLQLIQNFYDELTLKDKDSIVDRHIIAFDQKHNKHTRLSRELNDASIQASSLLPMLAKAHNLMALHVYRFPQQEMGELLDKMLDAKLDNEWLWENRKYDLLSTERYLEAIADFYDYYDTFEKHYADKSKSNTEIRKEVTKDVRGKLEPRIAQELEIKLKKKHDQEIEAVKKETANLYPIETQLNQRINEKTIALICDTLNSLSSYNVLSDGEKRKKTLSDIEQKLHIALQNYFDSLFARFLKNVTEDYEKEKIDKLKEASKNDFYDTVEAFFEFIAEHNINEQGVSKLSLKDIFTVITNDKGVNIK
jgi:hypothetical protein